MRIVLMKEKRCQVKNLTTADGSICYSQISNFHNFHLNNISYYLNSFNKELPFEESLNTSIFRETNTYQKFVKKLTFIEMKKYLEILIAMMLVYQSYISDY
jgi:hypothetical protein